MNKIRVSIGIGFFFLITTILMGNNQKCTDLSNMGMKNGDSGVVILPKSAAAFRSELDYNYTWGSNETDSGTDIALDDSGNIYITGTTQGFGAGLNDAFVAKFNGTTGKSLLNITWGSGDSESGSGILLDGLGNVYITGDNSTGFDYDVFVAKFNSTTGKSLLNITWGGSYNDLGSDIALDDSGNIYITGYTGSKGAGGMDAFIAKFNSTTGKSLLNITWGNNGNDYGSDIVLDDSGNVYITGDTQNFGIYGNDAFVAKFNSTSGKSLLNITRGYTDNVDSGTGIALGSGNIYITGTTTDFSGAYTDIFIAKFDSITGESLLNITWNGSNYDQGADIALDDSGNINIVGRTVPLSSIYNDAVIAKFDGTTGKSLLTITWGGEYEDFGSGIVLDSSGNICITGYTDPLGTGMYMDAFIVKYSVIQVYIPPSDNNDDDNDDDDEPSPIIIPGYDLFFLIGFLGLSAVFLIKKCLK